jgi:tRNA wybutosine-synthesizing protein 1
METPGYQMTGRHSAVKLCYWAAKSLVEGRGCYKAKFYGIESHRCLEMSPTADTCDLHCRFCWRNQEWEGEQPPSDYDEPEPMLERALEAQRDLVSGYGGDARVDKARWKESLEPLHVAISLTGEPTLYPELSNFIHLCHDRRMTTFLVTNGMHPEVLRSLDPLPTQLYCSVTAPNRKIFQRLSLPRSEDAWDRLTESLQVLGELPTRTVIRHTLVRGWNMGWEEQYAALDSTARSDFIEVKGYAYMGRSRLRLARENVPSYAEVRSFAARLGELMGYEIEDEAEEASVVLLTKVRGRRWLPGHSSSPPTLP